MTLCCTRKILTATDGYWMLFLKNIPKPYWELFLIPVFIKWQVICTKRGGSWQDLWDMTFYTKIQSS